MAIVKTSGGQTVVTSGGRVLAVAGRWVTINGVHVFIKNGRITKGPPEMVGKTPEEIGKDAAKKSVEFASDGERKEAAKLLGKSGVTVDDIPGLVGAIEGAEVRVDIVSEEEGIWVNVSHPDYEANRVILRDDDGRAYIRNENFTVNKDKRGSGLGTKVFAEQVRAASAAGFDRIVTQAAQGGDTNGYYTWARLGYDSLIHDDLKLALKSNGTPLSAVDDPAIYNSQRLSDLMKTDAGRKWWKANGVTFDGTFDLKAGSLSRRVFDAYVKERTER